MVLIPASSLQLIWTSCRRGYIIIVTSTCFLRASQFRTQFNPSTVKVISWYSSIGCTCYLHRCISYFDNLAGSEVNIQQQVLPLMVKVNLRVMLMKEYPILPIYSEAGVSPSDAIKLICVSLFRFGFFVSWHINLCRLFNAKAILLEEQ